MFQCFLWASLLWTHEKNFYLHHESDYCNSLGIFRCLVLDTECHQHTLAALASDSPTLIRHSAWRWLSLCREREGWERLWQRQQRRVCVWEEWRAEESPRGAEICGICWTHTCQEPRTWTTREMLHCSCYVLTTMLRQKMNTAVWSLWLKRSDVSRVQLNICVSWP